MLKILDGLARFQQHIRPKNKRLFARLAKSQNPHAMVIACADSRVVPEFLTQSRPGDLFVSRNAGNIVPPTGKYVGGVTASIEYAVEALHVTDIVICGHTDCGAMKAVVDPKLVAGMKFVGTWLRYAADAAKEVREERPKLRGKALLDAVVERNVLLQLEHLSGHPSVRARLELGRIRLHGWVYDVGSGEVSIYHPWRREFVSLDEGSAEG
jgi:carbonic anhydrase